MAVTLATIPNPALAGRKCQISVTASSGNFVRVWCTDAPRDSKLRLALDKSGASRTIVFQGVDSGSSVDFLADKGGAYVFLLEEFTKGAAAYGGGYEGDPNAAPAEDLLASNSATLHFASPLVCNLGLGQDTAELLLYVNNNTIVATSNETHGVQSPAIRSPKSPKAKIAADATSVRTAVAALANITVTDALTPTVSETIDDLITNLNAHFVLAGIHSNNDTHNTVEEAFSNGTSPDGQKKALSELRRRLDNHFRNDNPNATPPGTGSGTYHNSGDTVDWTNIPLQGSPSDQVSVLALTADAWRSYEAHRVDEDNSLHDNPDNTNAAATLSPLLALHKAFVAQIALLVPVTPPNEHPGKAVLINGAGFKEA